MNSFNAASAATQTAADTSAVTEALEVTLDMVDVEAPVSSNVVDQQQQQQQQQKDDPLTDSESDSSCEEERAKTSSAKTSASTTFVFFKLLQQIFSAALLVFCIVVVAGAIFEKQTTATGEKGLHPAAAFVIFWVLLLYLAQLEGGLNIMVGLKPVDPKLYQLSHPHTYGCTQLTYKGDNIDRFIVGRQYLDLTMVFTTSLMVSAIDGAALSFLPQTLTNVFLDTGLAVTLVTIVIGQLVAIINSTHCMLEYVNNYIMLFSTYLALFVEASGILHAVYFIQILVGKFAGRCYRGSKVEERTPFHTFTFWLRVILSVSLLFFSIYITIKAILEGKTSVWKGVPPYASIIILLVLILIAGLMESLQIAFMTVVHMPRDELAREGQLHPTAKRNCDFIFAKKNRLQAFLIGRQILQTVIMFVIARITTLDYAPDSPNLLGVSDAVQNILFNSGVLATLMSTIIASLSWRVLANTFPIAFLSFPLSRLVIYLCILTEATGVCSVAWPLSKLHRRLLRWKNDEYYLGRRRLEEVNNHAVLMRPSISVDDIVCMSASSHTSIDATEVHISSDHHHRTETPTADHVV